jgi:LmbE family N-acetylglucosaminyl deacetylase
MRAFDPDPQLRWLFAITHPDDEIAICGWIRRLVAMGAEVHLSWTHDTPEREYEARQAAKLLHVPKQNLHFHHGPDRRLAEAMPEMFPKVRRMVDEVRPDRIVVGAFEQGHMDHDATNLLVHRAFDGPIFETPLYHAYCQPIPVMNRFATPHGEEILELMAHEVALKKRVAQRYPSQAIWGNLVWYSLLLKLKMDREPFGLVERMRLQTHTDFEEPHLPLRLAERVKKTQRWKRWIAAVNAFEGTWIRSRA